MTEWLAVDPEATEKRRVPDQPDGLLVEFGFWPPSVERRLKARVRGVSVGKEEDQDKSPEDLERQYSYDDEVLSDAVRWSVRGWDGGPAAVVETVELAGMKHQRLSEESLARLRRNRLLIDAAAQAIRFNLGAPGEGKGGSGAS